MLHGIFRDKFCKIRSGIRKVLTLPLTFFTQLPQSSNKLVFRDDCIGDDVHMFAQLTATLMDRLIQQRQELLE